MNWETTKLLAISALALGILISFSSPTFALINDSTTLTQAKGLVEDPSGTLSSWNPSMQSNPCKWQGVVCSKQGRVVGLHFSNVTFQNSFFAFTVHSMAHLRELHVTNSIFRAPLKSMNGSLCMLEVIEFTRNQLISSSFLQEIFAYCKSMKVLTISNSGLYGELQQSIAIGINLETLDISSNKLYGRLPGRFFQASCKGLKHLDLSNNSFRGAVPAELFRNCISLEMLSLAHNGFYGSLPPLYNLPHIRYMDGSFNNFSGQVPEIAKNLMYLNLSSNNLATSVQGGLCSPGLTSYKLEKLILVNNNLRGEVLNTLMDCTRLKMLDLSFNEISGEIPENICNKLLSLEHFLAWVNNISGKIPSNLAACSNLSVIILSYNNLEGNIPGEIIYNLGKLQWLSLSNNRLSGLIPSLEPASELLLFQASNNTLEGEVPAEMVAMQVIELRGNNLSGKIPPSLGFGGKTVVVKLSVEDLQTAMDGTGGICMDTAFLVQGISLNKMSELLKLRSGCDNLINNLPSLTYGFNITSPLHIDYSQNRLVGEIPSTLGRMSDLQYLNFRQNLLSGIIPPELGELKNIVVLDLAHNSLQGNIPSTLSALSFLVELDLSFNNLSGPIPGGGQFATMEPEVFAGNPGLCGDLSWTKPCLTQSREDEDSGHHENVHDQDFMVGVGFGVLGFMIGCTGVFYVDRLKPAICSFMI